jgi:hypothetical protein
LLDPDDHPAAVDGGGLEVSVVRVFETTGWVK